MLRVALAAEDWARRNRLNRFPAMVKVTMAAPKGGFALADAISGYMASSYPHIALRDKLVATATAACRAEFANRDGENTAKLALGIIAKEPVSPAERGVLMVSFEFQLEYLVRLKSFAEIEKLYQIVFLPTWSPCYSGALFRLAARATLPYYVLSALPEDRAITGELGPLCVVLPLQASSWVSAKQFAPAAVKDIDILMIANFSKYKRHWLLFQALQEAAGPWRVVLAGRSWRGRTADSLRREAALFKVEDRIEIQESPSDEEIADLLGRARFLCGLSHKEGSYVALAEALMSGTPVGVFSNATIGSKAFINAETGILFDPARPLGSQLRDALAEASTLKPRAWAEANISADANVRLFERLLSEDAATRGQPWTQGLVQFYCRNFYFHYDDPQDASRMAKAYEQLQTRCGLDVPVKP
jgi:glycosyltransferase involved in cell wall biosynthesis